MTCIKSNLDAWFVHTEDLLQRFRCTKSKVFYIGASSSTTDTLNGKLLSTKHDTPYKELGKFENMTALNFMPMFQCSWLLIVYMCSTFSNNILWYSMQADEENAQCTLQLHRPYYMDWYKSKYQQDYQEIILMWYCIAKSGKIKRDCWNSWCSKLELSLSAKTFSSY